MRILLDTHILLWMVSDNPKLSIEHRNQLKNAEKVFVSLVSLWECIIKINAGKLTLDMQKMLGLLEDFGLEILPLRMTHLQALIGLAPKHKDPFDRMLIAQAKAEPLILLTDDQHILAYF